MVGRWRTHYWCACSPHPLQTPPHAHPPQTWSSAPRVLLSVLLRITVIYCSILTFNVLGSLNTHYKNERSDLLWYTVIYCDILWCTVIYCDVLWYTVVYCGILWYTVVYCGILWYTVIYCDRYSLTSVWRRPCWQRTAGRLALPWTRDHGSRQTRSLLELVKNDRDG